MKLDNAALKAIKIILDEKLSKIAILPCVALGLASKKEHTEYDIEKLIAVVVGARDTFDDLERLWSESPSEEVREYLESKGVGSQDFYEAKKSCQQVASMILPD